MEPQVRSLASDVQLLPQVYHFLHLNQGNTLRKDRSIRMCPASTFLKAMATSIDENRQNPFGNVVTLRIAECLLYIFLLTTKLFYCQYDGVIGGHIDTLPLDFPDGSNYFVAKFQ